MKKIMTENGLFVLGWLETQLHDILWVVHDGKNRGRSEGEENFRELNGELKEWGSSLCVS